MKTFSTPLPATVAPSHNQLETVAKGFADTLETDLLIGDSIAAHARYAVSLLKFPNGRELIADFYYMVDTALFAKVGNKLDNTRGNKTWRTFRNQVQILAKNDAGLFLRITCPGGVYTVKDCRPLTAAERKPATDSGKATEKRRARVASDGAEFSAERIADYLSRAIQSGIDADELLQVTLNTAYKQQGARAKAAARLAERNQPKSKKAKTA
ncbi:MAG: hypothetical protein KJP06_04210 [Deltaproteobacteria bacterium]|nr:hypothetical protein [Deltaproteobacteria bacterium]